MKTRKIKIFCCECNKDINARLTDGTEVYPHREDLSKVPFWICDTCSNYVGCHNRILSTTVPLGVIPSQEIKDYRISIHSYIDPIWKNGYMKRRDIYKHISEKIGKKYHTAELRTVEDCKKVMEIVRELRINIVMGEDQDVNEFT